MTVSEVEAKQMEKKRYAQTYSSDGLFRRQVNVVCKNSITIFESLNTCLMILLNSGGCHLRPCLLRSGTIKFSNPHIKLDVTDGVVDHVSVFKFPLLSENIFAVLHS